MILSIPFRPCPCPRPKVTHYGTFYGKNYTAFKQVVNEWLDKQKIMKLEGPLEAEMVFAIPMPDSWSKKKKAAHLTRAHAVKPDCDNLIKSVFDILNGRAFNDDSQIARIRASKIWVDSPGHIIVEINETTD
jgi:Holliday junction resolvase RusA-like endonuclease